MSRWMRRQMRSAAVLAVAAALVVGGVAAAQGNGSGDGSNSNGTSTQSGHPIGPPPGGGPAIGMAMNGLTYAEMHVLNSDGDAETIRIDQGKVKSVGSDSITLTENDDSEVTVAVDDDTQVLGKPGEETALSDLEAGQQVSVSAADGKAASTIMVLPKKGDVAFMKGAPGAMPPPPGVAGKPEFFNDSSSRSAERRK